MAYVKKDWEDLPSTDTPITASDLDRIENGIEYNDQRLNGTKPIDNTIYVNDVKCKNLYDANTMLLNQGLWSGGYTSIETNNNGWYVVVPVKENTTYTISKKYTNIDNNALNCWITITSQYPANGVTTLINFESHSSQTSWSITTPTGAKYLFLGLIASGSPSNELKAMATAELQVEIGSSATPYTPHVPIGEEIYSTNEIRIGTFSDGKPLYKKLVNTTQINLSANTWTTLTNDSTISSLVKVYVGENTNFVGGISSSMMCRKNSSNDIQVYSFVAYSIKSYILEYTKTTD